MWKLYLHYALLISYETNIPFNIPVSDTISVDLGFFILLSHSNDHAPFCIVPSRDVFPLHVMLTRAENDAAMFHQRGYKRRRRDAPVPFQNEIRSPLSGAYFGQLPFSRSRITHTHKKKALFHLKNHISRTFISDELDEERADTLWPQSRDWRPSCFRRHGNHHPTRRLAAFHSVVTFLRLPRSLSSSLHDSREEDRGR